MRKVWLVGILVAVLVIAATIATVATATSEDKNTPEKINSKREAIHKACRDLTNFIGLKEVESKIGDTITTFGGLFIDEEQSTIYVYVMNQEDARKVEEIISPYKNDVNLKILKGKYTFKQLMKWKNDLTKSLLENNRDLNVTLIDIEDTKNKLEIGVEVMENLKIKAIRQEIQRLNIPQEAVDVIETGPIVEQASRTDKFDPLIGGIQVEAEDHNPCTLGFTATKDGVKGIVMTGHCAGLNKNVYQPIQDLFGIR